MFRRPILIVLAGLAVIAAACTPSSSDGTGALSTSSTRAGTTVTAGSIPSSQDGSFPEFLESIGGEMLRRDPQLVTELGLAELLGQSDNQLNDLSFPYRTETAWIATDALASLDSFPVDELSDDEAISAAILRWHLEDIVALSAFPDHDYAVNYITGAHTNLPEFLSDVHPIATIADAEAYITRLEAAGDQMRQVADNVTRSEAAGIIPTTTGLQIAAFQINNALEQPDDHPLVLDMVARVSEIDGITETDIATLRDAAVAALEDQFLRGYRYLLEVVNRVEGRSETSPGVSELPLGNDYYATILRHHVSSDMTPQEAHQLGLENVDRLVAEISPVVAELGYDVDAMGFGPAVAGATSDAGFFALTNEASRAEVLALATQEVEDAQETFSSMFETFPDSPLLVVRPRPGREGGPGAYYIPPPAIGERPGLYYLSLGGRGLGKQTFYTTNYHEAIPGHHFQLALQRESEDLPLLQRAITFGGFAEGWALYAERLAFEAGLYDDDPQGNLGRLRMELLRAARVVADTGIHDLGWSRDEAIDYMTDLGFGQGHASSEVDRYIVWPGQAPSYLIGMLEILRLRDEAMAALGPDFDLAAFHTEVLRHGGVPLSVLDGVITTYVETNS